MSAAHPPRMPDPLSSAPTAPGIGLDPAWRARLEARAARPPVPAREPLSGDADAAAAAEIGSVEPEVALRLAHGGLPLRRAADGRGWHVVGALDDGLRRIAEGLAAAGLGGRWRDELLDVVDERGMRRGVVERAAVRALGIATHAVHLVGSRADGRVWVQQRAFDKAVDPGLWDTLMGGLVGAGESTAEALARETDEEAGLAVAALQQVDSAGRFTVRRPVPDGYMVEHIEVFDAVVPDGVEPRNRDGEVARFECLEPAALKQRLEADAFTLEAALILTGWLQRRGPTGA